MARDEIHVNDTGTAFIVTVKDGDNVVDISTVTTKEIIFRKPGGTILVKTASFYTDGTDGKMQYITASGDLDSSGTWMLEGFVQFSATRFWKTDYVEFKVSKNLI